ncbi:MAG: hypothetical protein FWC28_05270 [Proteobacteria bacterium]|nr:hypothetical protein [Cystobacterineae bacterium]MCL2258888.1 hypothetical protein [Cystobacterineae bacterium]MCL2314648.1 hypothetical protein [Pseudomonadota bacterium]
MAIHIPKSRAGNTTPQSIQTNRNTTDKVAAYKKHLNDSFDKGTSKPTPSGFEPKKATGLVMPDNQPQVLRAVSLGEENPPGGSDDCAYCGPETGTLPDKGYKKMGKEEQYAEAVMQLGRNFSTVDTAYADTGLGHWGDGDGEIGLDDLKAIAYNPKFHKDLRRACRFLLDNPEYFTRLETAGDNSEFDGKIHKSDINAEYDNFDNLKRDGVG